MSPSLNALFDFAGSFGMKPSELLRLMEREIGRECDLFRTVYGS